MGDPARCDSQTSNKRVNTWTTHLPTTQINSDLLLSWLSANFMKHSVTEEDHPRHTRERFAKFYFVRDCA
jgi:hypothetical protein